MPCTGKDTLSWHLVKRDPVFALLRKHRAVSESASHSQEQTYINVSPETFQALAESNSFIQYHGRYGKMYGVSREEYTALLRAQKIPIIHVGKYENLRVLRQGGLQEGLSVLLWANREIVQSRLYERHQHRTDGVEERLMAYDQEVAQLRHAVTEGDLDFHLVFENNGADPGAACEALLTILRTPSAWSTTATQTRLRQLLQDNRP
jgi:guanylate kinase